MAEKQIIIDCGINWFEFSRSFTGQLDYCGKIENPENLNFKNCNIKLHYFLNFFSKSVD